MLQQPIAARADQLAVTVRSMTLLAKDTLALELVADGGAELPPFSAGAHVDLLLPNGIRRSYSLCNSSGERHRYVVGVKKADPSRGASAFIHDTLRVGARITVTAPRNNFPLDEKASRSVLIAGGIGITPIMSMIDRLEELRADWTLYYAARTRADAAFLEQLQELGTTAPGRIHMRFDREPGNAMLDLAAIVESERGAGVHFYACGPGPMLDAFEAATAALPPGTCHLERFGAAPQAVSEDGLETFEVVLARSGRSLTVGPGTTILDQLLEHGIDLPFSCMEGVCGSCRVAVLDGIPDHRDMVLTDDEMAANGCMMVCCSGSRSAQLILDI
ncbi:MAG: PDR/VanB family oxidoreductase [Sneathiellaceae bacterium]